MAAIKIGTTIQINETDSSFDADKVVLNEDGLLFTKADTIGIGSTVTADGGEVVNIIQGNEPRVSCKPGGSVEIPLLQAGEILATNDTGDEICGTYTYSQLSMTHTVATTKAKTGSIIVLTAHTSTPDGYLYIDSINDGVSFEVGYTGSNDQEMFWLIINPV